MNAVTPQIALADRRIPNNPRFLDAAARAQLTPALVEARLRALKPMIAAHAKEAEELRRPVDAVWQAIRDTGLFYLFVPKVFGGMEGTPEDLLDLVQPIAEACMSTAWCASFCTTHNWYLSRMPMETQQELWGDGRYVIGPDTGYPAGLATAVPGGYRVKGQWKWGSGVMHADWIFVRSMFHGETGPRVLQTLLPADEVVVLDTWRMEGMAATGSNDILIDDVFVPAARTQFFDEIRAARPPGSGLHDGQIYRMPILSLHVITASVPALGAARGAIDHLRARASEHTTLFTGAVQAERVPTHLRLARAELMVRSAELLLRDVCRRGPQLADLADPEQTNERVRMRAQASQAVALCREAIGVIMEAAGSSVHALSHPLQRAKRDVDVLSSHGVYDMDSSLENYGRVMLGLPPSMPLF